MKKPYPFFFKILVFFNSSCVYNETFYKKKKSLFDDIHVYHIILYRLCTLKWLLGFSLAWQNFYYYKQTGIYQLTWCQVHSIAITPDAALYHTIKHLALLILAVCCTITQPPSPSPVDIALIKCQLSTSQATTRAIWNPSLQE